MVLTASTIILLYWRITIRCKACDNVLKNQEIYTNKKTGRLEELCSVCRSYAINPDTTETTTGDDLVDSALASKYLDIIGETYE